MCVQEYLTQRINFHKSRRHFVIILIISSLAVWPINIVASESEVENPHKIYHDNIMTESSPESSPALAYAFAENENNFNYNVKRVSRTPRVILRLPGESGMLNPGKVKAPVKRRRNFRRIRIEKLPSTFDLISRPLNNQAAEERSSGDVQIKDSEGEYRDQEKLRNQISRIREYRRNQTQIAEIFSVPLRSPPTNINNNKNNNDTNVKIWKDISKDIYAKIKPTLSQPNSVVEVLLVKDYDSVPSPSTGIRKKKKKINSELRLSKIEEDEISSADLEFGNKLRSNVKKFGHLNTHNNRPTFTLEKIYFTPVEESNNYHLAIEGGSHVNGNSYYSSTPHVFLKSKARDVSQNIKLPISPSSYSLSISKSGSNNNNNEYSTSTLDILKQSSLLEDEEEGQFVMHNPTPNPLSLEDPVALPSTKIGDHFHSGAVTISSVEPLTASPSIPPPHSQNVITSNNPFMEQIIQTTTSATSDSTSIPGLPGIDYPIYDEIPPTSFDCRQQRYKGFFADIETKCQVWHYCDFNDNQNSFLCGNGTVFSQHILTCDWWFNVDCSQSLQLYVLNERLYRYIKPPKPSFPEDYHGPGIDQWLLQQYQLGILPKIKKKVTDKTVITMSNN